MSIIPMGPLGVLSFRLMMENSYSLFLFQIVHSRILCFDDHASLYYLVNKGNLVQKSFSFSSYVALQLFYRVLAFSTNSFHLLLSWARVFQFGTFNFCISFLPSSTQRVLGLPIGLLEMGFQEYIAFTILVPCILSM